MTLRVIADALDRLEAAVRDHARAEQELWDARQAVHDAACPPAALVVDDATGDVTRLGAP